MGKAFIYHEAQWTSRLSRQEVGGSVSSHRGEAQDLAKSALGAQKRVSYPLELQLWAVLRPYVGARNEARILQKNSPCS